MASYRISGVWKNPSGIITHYAFHSVLTTELSRATKVTKFQAIKLVETPGNTTQTWVWDYQYGKWALGETVHVVGTGENKYLRSNPDKKVTDNLGHLVDFDWILP